MAALAGFASGAWLMATSGAIALASRLEVPATLAPSIPLAAGIPAWLVIAGACTAIGAILSLTSHRTGADRVSIGFGVALGALGVAAWVTGMHADWHWGLSVTGPTRSLLAAALALEPEALNWGAAMVAGIPAGAWIAARRRGPITWRTVSASTLARRALGGVLMGIGGTLAAGCNIGNALTGLSVLAVNSVIATAGIVAGVVAAVQLGRLAGTRAAPPTSRPSISAWRAPGRRSP